MITVSISGYDPEFEKLNQRSVHGSLFQSACWADLKSKWQRQVITVRCDGALTGGVSVLLRRIPFTPWKLLYAPRGPVCDPSDTETLAAITRGVRELANREHGYLFKTDPDVLLNDDAFQKSMASLGYQLLPETWAFDRIQPQHLARIDLRGKTAEQVLADMKQKTRYNIRLAERRGTKIRVCGADALDDFYEIMLETGRRDGFAVRPKRYFERMLSSLGRHVRLYLAYYENEPIAGATAAQYGNQTWYLYGASSARHREQMPNYLLQWHMIRWAIESGCDVYDFRGVSGGQEEDKVMGLWRFKGGFGAELQSLVGEYELPIKPAVCRLMQFLVPLMRSAALKLAEVKMKSGSRQNQLDQPPRFRRFGGLLDAFVIQFFCTIEQKEGCSHDSDSHCGGRTPDL